MGRRGFVHYLFSKRWHLIDVLEPLVALPFGFGLIFVLEHGFDVYGFLLIIGLVLVYLPIIVTFFDRVVK